MIKIYRVLWLALVALIGVACEPEPNIPNGTYQPVSFNGFNPYTGEVHPTNISGSQELTVTSIGEEEYELSIKGTAYWNYPIGFQVECPSKAVSVVKLDTDGWTIAVVPISSACEASKDKKLEIILTKERLTYIADKYLLIEEYAKNGNNEISWQFTFVPWGTRL